MLSNSPDNESTLDANVTQREQLLKLEGRVGVATFLKLKDGGDIAPFLHSCRAAMEEVGANRLTTLRVTQLLMRRNNNNTDEEDAQGKDAPNFSFTHVTIDIFPYAEAITKVHDNTTADRQEHIQTMYSITFSPFSKNNTLNKATEVAASPWVRPLFRYMSKHKLDTNKSDHKANQEVLQTMGIQAESINSFLEDQTTHDMDHPFCIFSLQTAVDKERYQKDMADMITKPTLMNMVALGASYQTGGAITGTWIGHNPEDAKFEEFGLARWPSRTAYQTHLANLSKNVATAQRKFLAQQMQILCTPLYEVNECGVVLNL